MMEIEEIPVDELFGYIKNPRRNDAAVNYVANSIKEFGFKQPIVIDANNEIVAGHTRLKAAIKLHMKTVPCVRADDLTDEQIRAYRIADNRTAEFATWDTEKLAVEKRELESMNFDMAMFGFAPSFKPQTTVPANTGYLAEVYDDTPAQTAAEHEVQTTPTAQPAQTVTRQMTNDPENVSAPIKQPVYSKCPKCGRIHIIG